MADDDRGSGGRNGGVRRLVIVESPTKAHARSRAIWARTTSSSRRVGTSATCPGRCRRARQVQIEPWARLGNVDQDFEPSIIVSPEKKSTVTELKGLLEDVRRAHLATDGDREGEAIAWHLLETLKPRIPVKRMVFHEITEPAIRAAAGDPANWTTTWSTHGRRAASWTGCTAARSPRCCGRRSRRGSQPAGCSPWPPASSCSASGRMAFRSADYWDIAAELDASVSDPTAVRRCSRHGWSTRRRPPRGHRPGLRFARRADQARRGAGARPGQRR